MNHLKPFYKHYNLYLLFVWLIFATILNFSFILTNGMIVFEQ